MQKLVLLLQQRPRGMLDVEDTPPEVEEETPEGLVTLMEESLQPESRGSWSRRHDPGHQKNR